MHHSKQLHVTMESKQLQLTVVTEGIPMYHVGDKIDSYDDVDDEEDDGNRITIISLQHYIWMAELKGMEQHQVQQVERNRVCIPLTLLSSGQ